MTWVRLDDGLDEHEKVDALLESNELRGLAAVGLWTLTMANSARRETDGRVNPRTLRKLAPQHADKLAQELERVGLYDHLPDGFQIHDYLEYNPSRADLEDRRRRDSERKSRGGQNGIRAESERKDGRTPPGNPARRDKSVPVPGPIPVPKPTTGPSTAGDGGPVSVGQALRKAGYAEDAA